MYILTCVLWVLRTPNSEQKDRKRRQNEAKNVRPNIQHMREDIFLARFIQTIFISLNGLALSCRATFWGHFYFIFTVYLFPKPI